MPRTYKPTGRPRGRPRKQPAVIPPKLISPDEYRDLKQTLEQADARVADGTTARSVLEGRRAPLIKPKRKDLSTQELKEATARARSAVANMVEEYQDVAFSWLERIAQTNPDKAFGFYLSILEYHLPKLARTETTAEIKHKHEVFVPVEQRHEAPEPITLVPDDTGEFCAIDRSPKAFWRSSHENAPSVTEEPKTEPESK